MTQLTRSDLGTYLLSVLLVLGGSACSTQAIPPQNTQVGGSAGASPGTGGSAGTGGYAGTSSLGGHAGASGTSGTGGGGGTGGMGGCTPGSQMCLSNTMLQTCNTAGQPQTMTCPNACINGACGGQCVPGTNSCMSSTVLQSCTSTGTLQTITCPDVCKNGACTGSCVPGAKACLSATILQTCDSSGNMQMMTCPNACVNGACSGTCVPGSTLCTSDTMVQTCDNTGTPSTMKCTNACVMSTNSCGGSCVPQATQCSSDNITLQTCDSTGTWQSKKCADACVTSGGTSMCGGSCVPGSTQCASDHVTLQTCDNTGTPGTTSCPFVCVTNGSVSMCGGSCVPGATQCESDHVTLQTCDSTGTLQPSTCPFACLTSGSTSMCGGSCVPGTKGCEMDGLTPETCDDTGTFQPGMKCTAGNVCDSSTASCVPLGAPRPLAPLTSSTITSATPTLKWLLPAGADGAKVELCKDHACAGILQTFSATGSSGTVPTPLSQGVYYWRLQSTSQGATSTTYSPIWEFWIPQMKSGLMPSISAVNMDVNGDGYSDAIVGASGTNSPQVYLGSSSGLSGAPLALMGVSGDGVANFVSGAGDINNDGYADLLAGDASSDVFAVYLGSASGPSSSPTTIIRGPSGSGRFAGALMGVGDINGDGYADVMAGDFITNTAYLYLGSTSGLSSTIATMLSQSGGYFGGSLAPAGDVNGDGYSDVIIGATGGEAAYVYLGSASGISPTGTKLSGAGNYFGYSVASAGDVNGDGYADVIVGDDFDNQAYVYLGSASGISTTGTLLHGNGSSTQSQQVAGAGDINGDGYSDILIGEPKANTVYLFLGSSSGISSMGSTLALPSGAMSFGAAVAGAGDVNGDGLPDLLVGAPGTPVATNITGTIYCLLNSGGTFGTTQLTSPTPSINNLGSTLY